MSAAILIVTGVVIYASIKQDASAPGSSLEIPGSPSPAQSPPEVLKPTPTPSAQKPITSLKLVGKPLPGFSYQEAVETYKDRRFQFDDACNATPNFLTFKNGPDVMFDNRSSAEKIIKLDKIGYKVGPFGFIVLTITAPTTPYSIEVDCNQLFNTAIINLQK